MSLGNLTNGYKMKGGAIVVMAAGAAMVALALHHIAVLDAAHFDALFAGGLGAFGKGYSDYGRAHKADKATAAVLVAAGKITPSEAAKV